MISEKLVGWSKDKNQNQKGPSKTDCYKWIYGYSKLIMSPVEVNKNEI